MKNIIKIIRIAKPLYKIVGILAILILISASLGLVAPLLNKSIVDEITAKISNQGGTVEQLITLIALAFAVNTLSILIRAVSERIGDHFAGKLRQFLTEKFYNKVLTLPQSYFDTELSGKIVNQLNRGITTIQGFMNTATNFMLPTFLQSIFTIIVLTKLSPAIGFFTFLLFPVYISISYYSTKKWGEREGKKNQIEDVTRGRIQEVISNIKLVKSFTNESNEYNTISGNLTDINKIYAKQSRDFHIIDFARNFSLNLIFLGIDLIAFYNAFQGNFTIGELVLILQLVQQARMPLFGMSFILTQIQYAEAGSKEFFEVLNLESTEDYSKEESTKKIENPVIEFKNVEFKYENNENTVLEKVSFKLDKNEKVALVGHSGSGKSTIVNLILKFYNPTNGEIFLNGQNYKELTHKSVRNNISLVFQENELFSSTIRENVAYGKDATDEQVIEALRLANAWDFVQKLPKGIMSEVGERGVRLSGGQKQRIQIARAILKDSPILILDEATSSLDAKSESEVQEALETLMKNRLTLIIAHRFSTIQNVDKIIVLNEGKIEDSGNPKELAGKQGIYHDLLQYQIQGNEKLLKGFELA